jgi:hypothetical protein
MTHPSKIEVKVVVHEGAKTKKCVVEGTVKKNEA